VEIHVDQDEIGRISGPPGDGRHQENHKQGKDHSYDSPHRVPPSSERRIGRCAAYITKFITKLGLDYRVTAAFTPISFPLTASAAARNV